MVGRHGLLVAGLAALIMACGGPGGNPSEAPAPSEGAAQASEEITIVFENPQFEDATVYIQFEGTGRRRLGRVSGASAEEWTFPTPGTSFVIEASFMAVGNIDTDPIYATPGDTVTITAQSSGILTYSISR